MKALYSILFAGCLLSSCAPSPRPQWTKGEIVGLRIELIDHAAFESMTFTSDGLVPLIVGPRDGPVAGPLFYWEFVSGRLRITTDGNQLYDEFTLISRNAKTLKVRRHNGKVAKFKILQK